jgi:hypothetical protein
MPLAPSLKASVGLGRLIDARLEQLSNHTLEDSEELRYEIFRLATLLRGEAAKLDALVRGSY